MGSPTCSLRALSSVEYPTGSQVQYVSGALWVGGVRGADSLVSKGLSPFANVTEFWPSICEVVERAPSNLGDESCLDQARSDSAKSDYDITIWLADTVYTPSYVKPDPFDGRPHRPLGIALRQSSYSWSTGNTAHFVIIDYELTNLGTPGGTHWEASGRSLKNVYVGFYATTRAGYDLDPFHSWDDNLVEFQRASVSNLAPEIEEEINLVLPMDNDGDPNIAPFSGYSRFSSQNAVGIAILRKPLPQSSVNFNWWVANPDPSKDWGPVLRTSTVEFPNGGLGSPLGDRASYMQMSNGEQDYPQYEASLDHSVRGWLPPPSSRPFSDSIASGAQIQFLLSMGPFDLPRDSTIRFAIAVVGGRDLHWDPNNFRVNFDPQHPDVYRSRLDLSDLLRNTQWARWTWDNPGVDTDHDGYAGKWFLRGGDTVYYEGDGVPDIRAAMPPRTSALTFDTRSHRVAIHWNGYRTETEKDVFTQRADFEGYRIYLSRTGREDEWAFLTQRDLFNYARYTWNRARERWEMQDPPYTLDSLKTLYDALCDTSYGFPFHPDSFPVPELDRALLEVHFDPEHPEELDSIYRYFTPYEANNVPDDAGLAMAAAAGVDVTGVIRKLYPQASRTDTAYREDGTPYLPYYEYEYVVKDLEVAEPVFLSVTAFDHGDPASRLAPLESAKSITAREVWPVNDAEVVKAERPKPGVYPNPYRLIDDYYGNNWENRRGLEPDRERARQVTFYNVPDTCTLSIWTLDGDLVRKLYHASDPASSEATVVRWDLITRNTQAVKTGIYIWSVESRFGTDVGKLVIIK
jgi:hypothetical protein